MNNIPAQQNANVVENLRHIPFFRSLSPETLQTISSRLKLVSYEHDQVVFTEGSLGNSMYLIESGQVKVSVSTGSGSEKIINYLGPNNFFGEMALILDQRRTATVTVTIDADLWMLHKADLDELLVDNPEIALQITRELSRRLSASVTQTTQRRGYRLSAVMGKQVWRLAHSIQQITGQRVVLFDLTDEDLSAQVPPEIQSEYLAVLESMSDLSSDSFVETMGILADGYDWVLVVLPEQDNPASAKALQISDALVLCDTKAPAWVIDRCPGPTFTCNNSQTSVDRTARKITRRVVGLALSSGGARGIAHIGVLQALEEAGIPIDMIAGTSAGSLFGGMYAVGKPVTEIAEFAQNMLKHISFKSGLWDPKFKLPWNGLIKGIATRKFLAKQLNDATFADTRIPFFVVAADVMSGEEVVFEEGPLADAVRASIGMIGIFAPYQIGDHYLIDGGAVNPVPASVLAEKGADIIIASSVIPSIEEERARGRANSRRFRHPSFFNVLSNMMSIMEREIVKTRMSPVDVLIKPKVEVFTAMDYDKADQFLQLGREAVQHNLPLLQKLFSNSYN